MKKCIKCGKQKDLSSFYRNRDGKDGRLNSCKSCVRKDRIYFNRTKKGLISRIYDNQTQNSKARGHNAPGYTKAELREMLMASDLFNKIFNEWELSGYAKRLTPSIDRKNDYVGYEITNIQIMTWGENDDKGHSDLKSAKLFDNHSPISQYSISGMFIKSYISQAEASRITKVNKGNIGECCRGNRKKAGGFKWEYSK